MTGPVAIPSLQRRWLVAARPLGRALSESDFALDSASVRMPEVGEVLVRTMLLDFAPAQKSWMENVASYRGLVAIGDVMPGGGVGQVLASRDARFAVGDIVSGYTGWEECPTLAARGLTTVPATVDPAAALSILGTTGKTAYAGLVLIGQPRPGDTVLVSGAAGAVGTLAGQIARIAGCRTVGIAGGPDKCRWLEDVVGYDHAVDYKDPGFRAALKAAVPDGADVVFDNVGGEVLDLMLARLAKGARVVICGGISRYDFDGRGDAPEGPRNYFNIVATGATMQGFIVHQFADRFAAIEARLADWLRTGALRRHEDIAEGFEHAPATLMRLFAGHNRGKQLLRVADAI